VLYELAETIDQTQKRTHIVHNFENWLSLDGLNFLGVRASLLIHDMAQVIYLLLGKAGLSFTHIKLLTLQRFQNQTHMRLVFSLSLEENQNVINVDNNKLSDVRMKDRIHL
jgi:hypothetical protein